VPTYLFVVSFASMLAYGFARWLVGWEVAAPPPIAPIEVSQPLTIFLVLRAFASGCAALTGVEAVSDGVPAFRPPEARNARIVLAWLGIILITLFMGITFLTRHYHVIPRPEETVVSQLARLIFGGGLGVFVSFTLSQASMVRRWLSRREPGWWWRWGLNAVGATTTGLVMLVIAATKFSHGAWIVVLLIPLLVTLFLMIHRHYGDVASQLSLDNYGGPPPIDHTVLVLVGDLHRGVAAALRYAQALSASVKAVYVELAPDRTQKLEEKWGKFGLGVPLVVLTSPYRSLLTPFLDYVSHLLALGDNHVVTIVIPEFVPARWWQHLLHNQTALLIKGALLFRKGAWWSWTSRSTSGEPHALTPSNNKDMQDLRMATT
jgi:hypothetical protein